MILLQCDNPACGVIQRRDRTSQWVQVRVADNDEEVFCSARCAEVAMHRMTSKPAPSEPQVFTYPAHTYVTLGNR